MTGLKIKQAKPCLIGISIKLKDAKTLEFIVIFFCLYDIAVMLYNFKLVLICLF